MPVIVLQFVGVLVFLGGSIRLGRQMRRSADRGNAARASRLSHLLFWGGLALPGLVGVIHPGLRAYDTILGLPGLPVHPVRFVIGATLLAAGLFFMVAANRFLATPGKGAAAFLLTERLVTGGPYRWTRNPMSLGFYAFCLGTGVVAGSLSVTLGVLLIVVPAHVFHLKHFEERELEIRYGRPYRDYVLRVPFLIPRFRRS